MLLAGTDRPHARATEIEQPEHSYGYDFLAGKTLPNGTTDGSGMMEFCTGAMMYNDPANKTVNTLKQIYTEMVSLFPDAVFHMGGDEPYCVRLLYLQLHGCGRCLKGRVCAQWHYTVHRSISARLNRCSAWKARWHVM